MVFILSHFFQTRDFIEQHPYGIESAELFNDTAHPLFTTTLIIYFSKS